MKILVLYDGKAGHLTQAMGAANLIRTRSPQPVSITTCIAKPRVKLFNRLTRLLVTLLPRPLLPLIKIFYSGNIASEPADLVISFGGNSVALNVALKRYWHSSNIAIGNRYGLACKFFDAAITMAGETANPHSVASHIALCKTDPHRAAKLGREFTTTQPAQKPIWSLLIGGNGSGYQYQNSDWQKLAEALVTLSHTHGVQWLITNSRRSGCASETTLKQALTDAVCLQTYFSGEGNLGDIEAIMAASERVFCTEDSLSMLTEAVALAKPVVTLRPETVYRKRVHSTAVEYMAGQGLITSMAIADLAEYRPQAHPVLKSYEAHLDEIYDQLARLIQPITNRRISTFADSAVAVV